MTWWVEPEVVSSVNLERSSTLPALPCPPIFISEAH